MPSVVLKLLPPRDTVYWCATGAVNFHHTDRPEPPAGFSSPVSGVMPALVPVSTCPDAITVALAKLSFAGGGGLTARTAARVVLPLPVSVLVNAIVPGYVSDGRPLAVALTVKVIVVGALAAVPEVADGVSQFGTPEI